MGRRILIPRIAGTGRHDEPEALGERGEVERGLGHGFEEVEGEAGGAGGAEVAQVGVDVVGVGADGVRGGGEGAPVGVGGFGGVEGGAGCDEEGERVGAGDGTGG